MPELKLDLGCGQRKREGFTGVDKYAAKGVDQQVDLFEFPWPWEDNSVDEVWSSHFFEHVPAKIRMRFMDELYRVLKPGAKAVIIVPYGGSLRAVQDPSHEWPPVVENSFLYFNLGWREMNGLTHGAYEAKCDFDFTYGFQLSGDWIIRSQETQQFAVRNYLNAADDLHVTLVKRVPPPAEPEKPSSAP